MEAIEMGWHLVSTALESLQMASVFFSFEIPWSSHLYENFFEKCVKLRLAFTGEGFLALFLIAVCSVLLFMLLLVIEMCLDSCFECCLSFFWEKIGNELWFGILFVPMVSLVLEIFRCEDGYLVSYSELKCWKGSHGAYVFLAVLTLIVLIAVGAYKAMADNRYSKRPCSKKDCSQHPNCGHRRYLLRIADHENFVATKYMVWRLIIIILGIIAESVGHIAQVAFLTLVVILGLYPFLLFVGRVPHQIMAINYFKAAVHAGTWWSFLSCFVAVLVENSENDASGIMLGFWPVAILCGFLVAVWRTKVMTDCCDVNLEPREEDQLHLNWNTMSNDTLTVTSKPFSFQAEDLVRTFNEDSLTICVQVKGLEDVDTFVKIIRDSLAEQQEKPVRGLILQPNENISMPQNSIKGNEALPPFYQILLEGNASIMKLESLCITGFRLRKEDVQSICRPLAKLENLVELDLYNNGLDDQAALEAVKMCKQFGTSFERLNLESNPIGGPTKAQIESSCKTSGLKVDLF